MKKILLIFLNMVYNKSKTKSCPAGQNKLPLNILTGDLNPCNTT